MAGLDLKAAVNAALRSMAASLPATAITFNGEYCSTAVQSSINEERVVNLYGSRDGYNFSVRVPADAFTSPVKSGDRITVGETTYGILGVHNDATGATIRIDIGDQFA
jgi:hypothetical protein